MVLFITLGIISVLLITFGVIDTNRLHETKAWVQSITFSVLAGGLLYVILVGAIFLAVTNSNAIPREWSYGWENQIVAMQDSKSYIVHRRNVEQSDRYHYMVDYGNGRYKQHWVNSNWSDIIEVDNQPYVIKTYIEKTAPKNWFQRDLARFYNFLYSEEDLDQRWEFYVPKGSVVQEFNIDMR